MAQLCYKIQMYFIFLFTINNSFKVQTCTLNILNFSCKQNCHKSQKCNFGNYKGIASEKCAFRYLMCKNNNNGTKTKSKLKLSKVKSCYCDFVITW